MKKFNLYLSMALVAFVAFIASCSDAGEWESYSPSEEKFTFTHTYESRTINANETSFLVPLMRTTKSDEVSIPITYKIDSIYASNFIVPDSVTFAKGSNTTDLKIEFKDLEIGKDYSIILYLDSTMVSASQHDSCDVSISLDYNWMPIGKGLFFDGFLFENEYEAEILKAEGFDRYRVLDPYSEGLDAEEIGEYAGKPCEYIEFWADEDGFVFFYPFAIGYNYKANPSQPVYAYHPRSFSSLRDPSYWTHNVQIDEFTFQLAPYYYIDGLGGWNYTQNDGVIVIKLPQ